MPGPARILVADDEARIAEVVQGYLEGQCRGFAFVEGRR